MKIRQTRTEANEVPRLGSPGAMAIAAAGSLDLAERISEASAREVKFVGINWVYSPVADVNTDPRNPVIGLVLPYILSRAADALLGVRSFSDGTCGRDTH